VNLALGNLRRPYSFFSDDILNGVVEAFDEVADPLIIAEFPKPGRQTLVIFIARYCLRRPKRRRFWGDHR
jgi:hypothetical protein